MNVQPPQQQTHKQNLDTFYRDIFPMEQMYAWTQYGNHTNQKETIKREYSITIASDANPDGVFSRYNACPSLSSFRNMFLLNGSNSSAYVSKLDIGPKFDYDVSRHTEQSIVPEEKELVFDIDMDEYNNVRTCCQDKKVCSLCFLYLTSAAKILKEVLTTTFGFKHVLFVFSGRRGIHCWISDYNARVLNTKQREGLASYLHSGLTDNKKLPNRMLDHPILAESFEILEREFVEKLMKNQSIFESFTQVDKLIETYFDSPHLLKPGWAQGKTKGKELPPKISFESKSYENKVIAWNRFKAAAISTGQMNGIKRIVLDYLYPRLDIEVSKQFNHLLKAPFCVHPATGKICVPIPFHEMDSFNPDTVPTLTAILTQHWENISKDQGSGNTRFPNEHGIVEVMPKPKSYALNTTLKPYIDHFTEFVRKVLVDERERRIQEHDQAQLYTNDW